MSSAPKTPPKPVNPRRSLREDRPKSLRRNSIAIKLASILDVTEGLAGVVVGFLLLIIGLLQPSALNSSILPTTVQPFLQYFAAVLSFSAEDSLFLGFGLMLLGILEMIAGYYLWRGSRVAAILSVAISIVGLTLIGAYAVIFALAGAFTYIHVVSTVVKIALIGYGWPYLTKRTVTPRPRAKTAPSQAPRA